MCCDSDSISIWPKHISYLTLITKVSVSIRDLSIPTHLTQSFGLYPHWHSFFRQLNSLLLFFFLTLPLNNYIEYLFKRCVISTNTVLLKSLPDCRVVMVFGFLGAAMTKFNTRNRVTVKTINTIKAVSAIPVGLKCETRYSCYC